MGSSGGKGGGGRSSAPNYTKIAQEQGKQDRLTAEQLTQSNRPNQTDMFGNTLTWNQSKGKTSQQNSEHARLTQLHDQALASGNKKAAANYAKQANEIVNSPDTTSWEQQVNLSPEQQQLLDQQNQRSLQAGQMSNTLLQRAQDTMSQPFSLQDIRGFDPSNAYTRSDVNTPQYDPNSGREVADALYRSVMDRAAPEQQREVGRLENQLRAQGLQPGTEAYNRAMVNLQTAHGDVQTQAAQNATLGGYQEARDIYSALLAGDQQRAGQLQQAAASARGDYESYLGGAQAQNQTRLTNRYLPINEMAQFMQYAGGPQTGFEGFATATGYNAPDLMGAAQARSGHQLAQQNASNAQKGSLLGAGATLGGAYLGNK